MRSFTTPSCIGGCSTFSAPTGLPSGVSSKVCLDCKLYEITKPAGARCAHVTFKSSIAGKFGEGVKVDIQISGSVYRDLAHFIDTDMEISGTFNSSGTLGSSSKGGPSTTISAPLTLTRTVKPVER